MNNDKKNCELNGLNGEAKAAFIERIWNTTPDKMCLAQMVYDDGGIPVNYIILDVNPAFEKQLGVARDEVINRKVTELFPHYDLAFIEKCGEAERSGTSLISVEHISESYLWYEVQVFPLGSGGQFITMAKDITERGKLEEGQCTTEENYQPHPAQSFEDKYNLIVDSIDQGFFIIDVIFDDNGKPIDMYYVESNRAATEMLGMDFTGHRLRDIDPNYEEYWYEILGNVALTGQSVRMEQYAEPNKKWYSFNIFKIGDENSRRIGNVFLDITESKRAKDALKESEGLFRTLFENTEDGFVLVQPIFDESGYSDNYLMVNMNQAWAEQTGLNVDDFIGKTIKESMPGVESSWPEAFAKVAKSGESIRFESFNHISDRWYDIYAFNYQDGLVGVLFRDISERKKVEEKLAFQSGILSSVHDAIIASDGNYIITYWNSMAEKMFGWNAEEAIGKHSGDLLQTKVPGSSRENGVKKMLHDDYYEGDAVYCHKDGSEIYTVVHANVIRGYNGRVTQIISSFRDVTVQRHAEEQLHLHSSIVESVREAIFAVDTNQNVLFWNKWAETQYGWREEEAIGRNLTQLFMPIHYEDGVSREKAVRDYIEKGWWQGEASYLRKDGSVIDVMSNGRVMKDQNGNITSMYIIHSDITERKRMEEALRESEEKYHNLFESMDEGYCIIEVLFDDNNSPLDYRFLEVNKAFERQTGLVDATGRYMREMAPDHEQHWFDIYGRIALTGEPVRFQNPADALGFFYDVYAFRIGQPQQRRVAILFNDITERKRMEEALRESEERQTFLLKLTDSLRPLSDASEIQRTAMSIVGEYLEVDRVMYNEITSDGKIIHIEDNYVRNGFKKVTGDFPVSSFGKAMGVLRRGEILIVEDQTTTPLKNPSEREASTSLQVYASATVPLIKNGRWVANFGVLDGTPRKWTEKDIAILQETAERIWAAVERAKAEEEVLKARDLLEVRVEERTRELANERQRFFDVLETLPVNICLLSPDYHVPFANRAFRERKGDPNNRPCYELICGFDQPCESCQALRPIETGEPVNWLFEAPDGSVFNTYDLPFIDADGSKLILEMSLDITEQIRTETEMARLDRLNLIGEMAASIGHEIRNPMTAVRGFLQMLGDKKEYQYDREYFDIMIEEMDRANQIITQYLGMAKNKIVNLQLQSLDKVIKAIYPIIQSEGNLREMRIKLDLGNPTEVLLDEKEMRQLILNMCRNAMEAMSPHGTLTIGTRQEGSEVILYLKDEGSGLSPEIMDKMGTPFLTTKENGTGLGLAVCYSIAARHNARIDYETGPAGTTFYVRFPINGEQSSMEMVKNGRGGATFQPKSIYIRNHTRVSFDKS